MRRFAFLLVAVAALGCGGGAAADLTLGPTDANVAGTFNLQTANGRLLPIIAVLNATEEWDLTADQMVIAADNTWAENSTYTVFALSDGSQTTRTSTISGTYAIANNQINFTITGNGTGTFTGSVTGSSLSVLYNGAHFLYSK